MWEPRNGRSAWLSEALRASAAALARGADMRPADADTIQRLATKMETYPAGAFIAPGRQASGAKWIVSGWLCQVRILPDARRQIFSVLLPGDVVATRPLRTAGACSLLALTRVDCYDATQMLAAAKDDGEREVLREAFEASLSLAEERKYDHIVRLGRHTAAERITNLLLELHDRLVPLGFVENETFRMPLTQEHLADALGLSLVHVHRTLKVLRSRGLVDMRMGQVTLVRPEKVEQLALGRQVLI